MKDLNCIVAKDDMIMFENSSKIFNVVIRVSILSLLDQRVSKLLHSLAAENPRRYSLQTIPSISVSIISYNTQSKGKPVKLILFQPQTQNFTEKLIKRFYEASCAIFLFDALNLQSFTAAKVFYNNFKEVHKEKNFPIAFIELINNSDDVVLNEPEILDESPNVSYYTLREDDTWKFTSILDSLKDQFFDLNLISEEEKAFEQLIKFNPDPYSTKQPEPGLFEFKNS